MKRILLLLFLIPICLCLFFAFAALAGGGLGAYTPLYVMPGYLISFVIGIYFYLKLFKITENKEIAIHLLLMFTAFFLIPLVFYISENKRHKMLAEKNALWELENCKTEITKEHHYSLRFCRGATGPHYTHPKALDEYKRENPVSPYTYGREGLQF